MTPAPNSTLYWSSVLTPNSSIPLPCVKPFPFFHTVLYPFLLFLFTLGMLSQLSLRQHKRAYTTSKLWLQRKALEDLGCTCVGVFLHKCRRFSLDSEPIYCQVHFPPHGSTRTSQAKRATRTCEHKQSNISCTGGDLQRSWKLSG